VLHFLRITSRLRRGRGFRPRGGSGSDGAMTFAFSLVCGKSPGFKVTMKSASADSAHSQNGASIAIRKIRHFLGYADEPTLFADESNKRSRRPHTEPLEHLQVLRQNVFRQ
jgi:hypothetical protein